MTIRSNGRGCCPIRMHRSGPIPAGSPEVRASLIRSARSPSEMAFKDRILPLLQSVFHVRAVPQLLQPLLECRIRLARTNCLTGGLPLPLLAHILRTPLNDLYEMPSKRRLHRITDLPRVKRIHGLLEIGDCVAW